MSNIQKIILEHIAHRSNVNINHFKQLITNQFKQEIYVIELKKAIIKKLPKGNNLKLIIS
jgi:hypothetical protein